MKKTNGFQYSQRMTYAIVSLAFLFINLGKLVYAKVVAILSSESIPFTQILLKAL